MAVKYNDLKKKKLEAPLTTTQLELVSLIEQHVDKELTEQFNFDAINIEANIIEFRIYPDSRRSIVDLPNHTRNKMMFELLKRYGKAGWEVKRWEGEDDGPNRPGLAWYKFSEKES